MLKKHRETLRKKSFQKRRRPSPLWNFGVKCQVFYSVQGAAKVLVIFLRNIIILVTFLFILVTFLFILVTFILVTF